MEITGIVYSTGVIPVTRVGDTAPVINDTDVMRITGVVLTTGAREITCVKKISSIQDLQNPYSAWLVENQVPFPVVVRPEGGSEQIGKDKIN